MGELISATRDKQNLPVILNVGQEVRILHGEHRGVVGNIIACEQDGADNTWHYFVKAGRVEYGPDTATELW